MLQEDEPDDYVIATGESHSVRELVDVAFDRVGLDPEATCSLDPRFLRPAEVEHLIGDHSKAKRAARLGAPDELRGPRTPHGGRRRGAARERRAGEAGGVGTSRTWEATTSSPAGAGSPGATSSRAWRGRERGPSAPTAAGGPDSTWTRPGRQCARRAGTVYHLAAQASVVRAWKAPGETLGGEHRHDPERAGGRALQAPTRPSSSPSSGEVYGAPGALPDRGGCARCGPRIPTPCRRPRATFSAGSTPMPTRCRVIRTRAFNQAGPGQSDEYVIGTHHPPGGRGRDRRGARLRPASSGTWMPAATSPMCATSPGLTLPAAELPAGVVQHLQRHSRSVAEIIEIGPRGAARIEVRYEVDPARVRPHEIMDIRGSAARLGEHTGWRPEIPLETTSRTPWSTGAAGSPARREASSTAPRPSISSRTRSPAVTPGGGASTPVMMRSPGRSSSPAAASRSAHRLDHRLEVGARAARPAPRPGLLAVHEHAGLARRGRPPRAGQRPRRGGRCCRRGCLPTPSERSGGVGHLERGQQGGDRCGRPRRSPPPPRARPRTSPPRGGEFRARLRARRALARKPARGAVIPSFSCMAGTLKPIFQPIGWAPAAIASRRAASMAAVPAAAASSLTGASRSSAPRGGRRPRRPRAPRSRLM